MNENIIVSKAALAEAYNNANENVKETLARIFGQETPQTVMDRVKTFEDAISLLGVDNPLVKEYFQMHDMSFSLDILSYQKLRIIVVALNEGWKPSKDEDRFCPYFHFYNQEDIKNMSKEKRAAIFLLNELNDKYAGIAFGHSTIVPSGANSYIGSRLCFKSKELAEYAGKQFIWLYADFYTLSNK